MSDDRSALDRVIREAREEPTPDLDWDRVEARLFERIDADDRQAPARSGAWRIVAALAAAAVIALFVGKLLHHPTASVARTTAPAPVAAPRVFSQNRVDGAELQRGDRVAAIGHAVVVDHPGRASWTLDSSGSAVVADTGDYLTIKLESGAISAQVVPSKRMETFAVEVDGTRVAVHGTRFRVEKKSDGLRVEVSEGVVAVGPAGHPGHTDGWLLRRGDSGDFRSDGKSGNVVRAETASATETTPAPSEPAKPVVPSQPAKPIAPSDSDLAKSVDVIESAVRSCYAHSAGNASGDEKSEVRVRFTTELSVVVSPNGRVSDTRFDPPLAPAVMSCVKSAAAGVKLPVSQKGATTTRSLLLGS